MIIQQGDVIIESIGIIPANTKAGKLSKGHIVLAEGETTGHAHRIAKVGGVVFKEGENGMYYLQNKEDLTVTHEEHKTVFIPPGTWRVRKVQEDDHFAEEARSVAD